MLHADIVKFISEPASPPRLVNILEEGKGKAKERREVGEGDDTVVVEDTSDEEDGETLQERFQLRSRFSRPGLPNVPLINDPPTRLEASLPAPLSYGPPWAHYIGGYQDRLLGGPLGLPGLRYTAPKGVEHKDNTGVVLG
jgi:hypothetical protein